MHHSDLGPPASAGDGTSDAVNPAPHAVFPGESELARRCRAFDWSATPLGPVDRWPTALRVAVRTALESPVATALWCGPEFTLVHNDAYGSVLGAKHPGALGRPAAAVWPEIWPELALQFAQVFDAGQPVFAQDTSFVLERVDGRGEETWFTYALVPLRDEGGAVIAIHNSAVETTGRVLAERTLTQLLDSAPAVMAVYSGPDHVVAYVNPTWERVVGKPGALGRPFRDVFPEMAATGLYEQLDRVRATGAPYAVSELLLPLQRWPGGPVEESYWDFVWTPADLRGGTIGAHRGNGVGADAPAGARPDILLHAIEVTAQVRARREAEAARAAAERARDEAERMRAEAEAAGRLKSEFLATMSHEFRTPLNAILGYAQLLDMGVLGATTPAQHAHLARLQASARHLLQLVNDVLDVAKVDAERMQVRRDTLATGAAVAAALALVQPQATAKGIRVEDHGEAGVGVAYVGDEHRVRQILVNLLANAVKFTPPGGVVTVRCGTADAPASGAIRGGSTAAGRWAFVRVADTGPGITPEVMGRLFEPFTQGDGALTRAHGGTGLGLAISRRLARLMAGDLTVESTPGEGAVFTLWLPAPRDAVTSLAADPDRAAPDAARAPRPLPGAEVLPLADSSRGGLDAAAHAVLHALGARLASDAERVSERYVVALRADPTFPGVRELPAAQLRNHTTPVVGLLASQLMTIGETRGRAPELLGDGAQVQRVMAELHGGQRHRLGWSEADLVRETPLLQAEVARALESAVRAVALDEPDAPDAADAPHARGVDGPRAVVAAAIRYAEEVARQVLDQHLHVSIQAYRAAVAAGTP